MSFLFSIPTLQRRSLFCFVFNTYPSSETRRAVGSLGFVFPSSFHPSVSPYNCFCWFFVMFVGFHFCCCLRLTKRNALRSSFFFLISNTYSSKSKNNGSGFLGCVSSSSFHLSGSPQNLLVVFVLPSFHPSLSPQNCRWNCPCVVVGPHFIHLSPPKTVVGIVLVLLLVLVAGHKSSSQVTKFCHRAGQEKNRQMSFFPSFKTFPLQTETKTK